MKNRTMSILIFVILSLMMIYFIACNSGKAPGTTVINTDVKFLENDFRKNTDSVWYKDFVLNDVDVETFEVVDYYFAKDKNHVFFYKSYRESKDYFMTEKFRFVKIENADPANFVSLGDGYGKDKHTVWYQEKSFKVSDLNSLTVFNHHIIKDQDIVYCDTKAIIGSDGSSFEILDDHYAKDAKLYYYISPKYDGTLDIKAISCHYETFSIIDYQYAKDNRNVYYLGKRLSGAESASFQLISHGYSKDNQNVFFRNKIISGADPASFTTFKQNEYSLGETVYAKDKTGIYINSNRFAEVDKATFRILNEKYTADKNGVYFGIKKLPHADVATFRVFPHFIGDADAEDKNHRYGEGKEIE